MGEAGDQVQHALELAYAYLNQRDRTEAEVRRRLHRRGVDASSTEEAVAILIDQRYLDDGRFAKLFAADKRHLDEWGSERIRRALIDRGIERDLVEEALAADGTLAGDPGQTDLDRAMTLLRRRFPIAPQERRQRDRALGMLLRKGYDGELALEALDAYSRDAASGTVR